MVCAKCKITPPFLPVVNGVHPRFLFALEDACWDLYPFFLPVFPYIRRAGGIWDAGEKKLGKVIVPDKWKEGASNTNESGGRKINENKLLSKKNRSALPSSPVEHSPLLLLLVFAVRIRLTSRANN
jgi:hypothetical protein